MGVPTHPANVGVIVIVDVTGLAVAFIAVNSGMLIVPLAARPIDAFEFVHVNVAPAGLLTKVFAGTDSPAQKVRLGSAVTIGNGFTVTVAIAVLLQPAVVPVTV
jgi:hypothetical protein